LRSAGKAEGDEKKGAIARLMDDLRATLSGGLKKNEVTFSQRRRSD